MMRKRSLVMIVFSGVLSLPVPSPAWAALKKVWAVSDGHKIESDDLGNPLQNTNAVWRQNAVHLLAARNEIVAFQLIIASDPVGIRALEVRLPQLKQQGGEDSLVYQPPERDPTLYVGRPIQIFSVNTMNILQPSKADWVYEKGKDVLPKDPVGWKPVQLVPENARQGKGGFPLRVPPSRNQAIWFDIYVARDKKPGVYEGEIQISADGAQQSVPVKLEVLGFELRDQNSMHAMVFYSSSQPELYHGRNLDPQYHRFAHRQRIELVHAYSEAAVQANLGRFSGEDFTRDKGYEGPGEGIGNQIIPASFYGPGKGYEDRESAWRNSDAWMTFLGRVFPYAITFLYMPDEPGAAEFQHIRKLAENVHSNRGPGVRLPIFVTHRYTPELDGAINIWDSGPAGYDIQRAIEERQRGHDYWVYNGGRPAGPAIVIESPATDARSMVWACFKHGIKVYFFWHGVHWEHNSQKQGERKQNVWANPVTFDNRGQPRKPIQDQGFINGDGVLMYPGEEKIHPNEDRGISGPCSTVQLANFRRGLQDHQYLTLARQAGLNDLVDRILQKIVPRVFSDAGDSIGFSENGEDYEQARRELAEAQVKAY